MKHVRSYWTWKSRKIHCIFNWQLVEVGCLFGCHVRKYRLENNAPVLFLMVGRWLSRNTVFGFKINDEINCIRDRAANRPHTPIRYYSGTCRAFVRLWAWKCNNSQFWSTFKVKEKKWNQIAQKYGISDNKKFPAVFRKTNMRNACNIHSKKERKKRNRLNTTKPSWKSGAALFPSFHKRANKSDIFMWWSIFGRNGAYIVRHRKANGPVRL